MQICDNNVRKYFVAIHIGIGFAIFQRDILVTQYFTSDIFFLDYQFKLIFLT